MVEAKQIPPVEAKQIPPVEAKQIQLVEVKQIPLAEIDIDLEWNSRSPANVTSLISSETDEESSGLEGLIANLIKVGQEQPVDIRPATPPFYKRTLLPYSLVSGFRRCTALQTVYADEGIKLEAGKAKLTNPNYTIIPGLNDGCVLAKVHPPLSESEAFMLNMRENANRESLTPPDTAMAVKRSIEQYGFKITDIAVQLGKTPASVSAYARIAALPITILNHWHKGGEFEGVQSGRRVAMLEMLEVAKREPHEHLDAYKRVLLHGIAKQNTTAWFERAKGRAAHMGNVLAKLQKDGFLTLQNNNWFGHIDTMVNIGKRTLSMPDGKALASCAEKAFDREVNRVTPEPKPEIEQDDSSDTDGIPEDLQ